MIGVILGIVVLDGYVMRSEPERANVAVRAAWLPNVIVNKEAVLIALAAKELLAAVDIAAPDSEARNQR